MVIITYMPYIMFTVSSSTEEVLAISGTRAFSKNWDEKKEVVVVRRV